MSFKDRKFDYDDNFEKFSDKKDIYSSSKPHINKHSHINKKSMRKSIRNRKIIFSLAIIIFIIIGLIGSALIYAYRMLDNLNYQPIENNDSEYVSGSTRDPMILNVALFGVDRHAEADIHSRSDSIMILSLDSRREKIKLTSLMRDMWVDIPGYKNSRINAAIALGGEQLAIKTIEHNFGIKIDRFCTVDFEGFKDIIDIMGGLDIEITAKEAHHINRLLIELDDALVKGGLKPFKSPLLKEVDGVQHLNGAQSLQYARSRKVPTAEGFMDDYARTFRQRRVISLVIEKFKSSNLATILSLIEKIGPYINTNLKKNEIITLGKNSLKYLKYQIKEFRLPQEGNFEGQNINGASVLVITDLNKARYDLAKFIYEDSVKESAYNHSSSSTKKSSVSQSYKNSTSKNSTNNADSNYTELNEESDLNKVENSKKSSSQIKETENISPFTNPQITSSNTHSYQKINSNSNTNSTTTTDTSKSFGNSSITKFNSEIKTETPAQTDKTKLTEENSIVSISSEKRIS